MITGRGQLASFRFLGRPATGLDLWHAADVFIKQIGNPRRFGVLPAGGSHPAG